MGHYGVARRARLQRPVTGDERLDLMVKGMPPVQALLAGYLSTADASDTI